MLRRVSPSALAARVLSQTPGSESWRKAAHALARAALSADAGAAADATRCIFAELVEPWCDSFEPQACDRYLEFMAECLLAEGAPAVNPVAGALRAMGFVTADKLRARARRLRRPQPVNFPADRVEKALVLSRVTLGADIAVAGVMIEAAKAAYPRAVIEFVGGEKSAAFFAGSPRVHRLPVPYARGAPLADRLNVWLEMRRAVAQAVGGLDRDAYVVLDPDSRLTQLGLLPVLDGDANYRFFESRSYGGRGGEPLGRLAARWCGEILPDLDAGGLQPRAALSRSDMQRGRKLREASPKPLAAVSLGVGEREAKRLSAAFEDRLLEMLRRAGYGILLDFGAGGAEAARAEERVRRFKGSTASFGHAAADLVTWRGSLSAFGGGIAACDCYLGYDSAAAHLAAALRTPVIEVFAGAASARMRQRWTPTGPAGVTLIPAEADTSEEDVLAAVERAIAR